jgi:hypothetical protein
VARGLIVGDKLVDAGRFVCREWPALKFRRHILSCGLRATNEVDQHHISHKGDCSLIGVEELLASICADDGCTGEIGGRVIDTEANTTGCPPV